MKKILASFAIIAATASVATGGTFALFSDTETSVGNTFTAGTMDLALNGQNGVAISPLINIAAGAGFAPGQTGSVGINLANWGSVTGSTLAFQVAGLTNQDNGLIEPESEAGDVTDGNGNGELQDQLSITIMDGVTTVAGPVALSGLTSPINIAGGLNPGQTRNLSFGYQYQNATTNNLTMSDSVSFSLQFNLGQ